MSAPQHKPNEASAPYNDDQPPPYSVAVGEAPYPNTGYPQSTMAGAAATPGGYPHIGFVADGHSGGGAAPAPVHTAAPGGYPHHAAPSGYPHPAGYPHPIQGVAYVQPGGMPSGAGAPGVPVSVIMAPPVGPDPISTYCTACQQQITTRVDYRNGWSTHIIACIVCFSTWFFSMCCLGLVPYCLNACKDAEHHCPNCNAYIGKYERC